MKDSDVFVDQYLNYLMIEKGLSDRTIESYGSDLARYSVFLQNNLIENIAEADTTIILKYLIDLRKEKLGARSRARHLVTLRGFYRFLAQEKVISANPTKIIDLPKTGLKLPDVLSVEDIQSIVEKLKDKNIGILITDHNVRETLSVCERAYIFNEGEVIAKGSPEEILEDKQVLSVYLGRDFRL